MIHKTYFNPKDRDGWLKLRASFVEKGMVGGSDVATILDANPFKSSLELFYTNVGYNQPSNMLNDKMICGIEFEDTIAHLFQFYDMQTGSFADNYAAGRKVRTVRNMNAIVTNDDYPYLFSNVDRLIKEDDGILEVKNMNGFVFKAYDKPNEHAMFVNCPRGVPPGYYAQLQSYMMVLKKKVGKFAFMLDGQDLKVIEIKEDDVIQGAIYDASLDFGTRVETGRNIMKEGVDIVHKLAMIEPDPTSEDSYNKFRNLQLIAIEDERKGKTVMGTEEIYNTARNYLAQAGPAKIIEDTKTLLSNKIKKFFMENEAEIIDFGDLGTITFKKRLSINLKDDV